MWFLNRSDTNEAAQSNDDDDDDDDDDDEKKLNLLQVWCQP